MIAGPPFGRPFDRSDDLLGQQHGGGIVSQPATSKFLTDGSGASRVFVAQ